MRTKRQIIQFQIFSWVIAYAALTLVLHLFDAAKSNLPGNGLEVHLFFKLRVAVVAGVIIGIAMGVVDILLLKLTNKKTIVSNDPLIFQPIAKLQKGIYNKTQPE